eukprot:9684502-Lingulodinium_polyedra.AAC.1
MAREVGQELVDRAEPDRLLERLCHGVLARGEPAKACAPGVALGLLHHFEVGEPDLVDGDLGVA